MKFGQECLDASEAGYEWCAEHEQYEEPNLEHEAIGQGSDVREGAAVDLYEEMRRIGYRIERATDEVARGVPGAEKRLYSCATDLHNLALIVKPAVVA